MLMEIILHYKYVRVRGTSSSSYRLFLLFVSLSVYLLGLVSILSVFYYPYIMNTKLRPSQADGDGDGDGDGEAIPSHHDR